LLGLDTWHKNHAGTKNYGVHALYKAGLSKRGIAAGISDADSDATAALATS
jgi:hypothetical protein